MANTSCRNLNIQGLSSEQIFLKDTLEWVGITPQYVKRSEYKSAPEQYTETHSTESAEQQTINVFAMQVVQCEFWDSGCLSYLGT